MNLPRAFKNRIKAGVPLAPRTTFRIGGNARYWYEPKDKRELADFLKQAGLSLPVFMIGSGSNLLIKEGVIKKIFIHLCAHDFNKIAVSGKKVTMGAGVRIGRLISVLSLKDLGGYEFLAGIPGTLGGALAMNAGAKSDPDSGASYKEIKDIVSWVDVLDRAGNPIRLSKGDIEFFYRNSSLRPCIIVGAQLELSPAGKKGVQERVKKLLRARIKRQDWRHPSAGSFFKNPQDNMPAGRLIELCGLKGLKVGGAQVSEKHANFFINAGEATSRDVLMLMEIVIKEVYNRFKIELTPEVEIVS